MADELPGSIPAAIPATAGHQFGAVYDLGGALALFFPDTHPCGPNRVEPWLILHQVGDIEWVEDLREGARFLGILPGVVGAAPADGGLADFTAALAAADVKWAHDLADPQSEPAYIQSLASTVWSLWVQPRLAGAPVDGREFYAMLLDRCGFVEDGEHSADGSAQNDLAAERADAIAAFIELAKGSPFPEALLPVDPRPTVDGDLRARAGSIGTLTAYLRTAFGSDLHDKLTAADFLDEDDVLQALAIWEDWLPNVAREIDQRHMAFDLMLADGRKSRDERIAAMATDALSAEQRADQTIQRLTRDHDDTAWRLKVVENSGRRTADELAATEAALIRWRERAEQAEARLAIPADAAVLPENWRQQLGWLFTVDDAGMHTRICRLVEMWQGKRHGTDDDAGLADDLQASSKLLQNSEQAPPSLAIPAEAEEGLRKQLLDWAKVLVQSGGVVVPADIAWKLRQLAAPAVGSDTTAPAWHARTCSGCGRIVAAREPEGVGQVLCTSCHPSDLPFKVQPDGRAALCRAMHAEFGECFLDADPAEHKDGHEGETGRWPVVPAEQEGGNHA